MQSTPVFRRAQPAEAAALTQIALAAKQSWGYPAEWMAEWRADLTITPGYIGRSPVCVAEVAGVAAGFLGLVYADQQWHLEHLWVLPAYHGRGLGRALFAEAVRQAGEVRAVELCIKADPNAEPFYLKMGAVRTGLEIYDLLGKIRREVPLLSYRLQ
ncbi:MAG: GNAT family N-acetyltransferase [bacterium]|nr:GNAT family N-acetyltransferase [bacterium]MDI1336962.1 GNAT family N-acetyltransferase [Lacunisphaera sp.]